MGSGAAAATTLRRTDMPNEPEKSFTCPTCLRVFNKKANLKVHSRKHTGEKPYSCSKPGCGRSFMWKSSVTFHEQNCPSGKKKDDAPPSPMSVASKGVQKRPKSSRNGPDMRTPPKQNSTASGAKRRPARARSPPTTPMTPEDLPKDPAYVKDDVMLNSHVNPQKQENRISSDIIGLSASFPIPNAAQTFTFSAHVPNNNQVTTAIALPQTNPLQTATFSSPFAISPPPPSPIPHPHAYGIPDGHTLPAPSTLLGEKRLQSGGGRPPIIPGSLPKHFLNLQGPKDNNGGKLFDLRVPSSPVPSGAKPPVMVSAKMPKMPIAMELDESDDEGPMKIVGAQDAFMRTGNPFGGFAPPARCSPLPVWSPIVCPGSSPMPLSPLAPFSPLPPDSPAHNAPNPVHPPLNQPSRSANTNW